MEKSNQTFPRPSPSTVKETGKFNQTVPYENFTRPKSHRFHYLVLSLLDCCPSKMNCQNISQFRNELGFGTDRELQLPRKALLSESMRCNPVVLSTV